MKFCTKCGTQCDDAANCCHKCGNRFDAAPAPAVAPAPAPQAMPAGMRVAYVDPHDHTGEMDRNDVSSNKVFAVAASLLPAMPFILLYCEEVKLLYGRPLDWLQVFLGNYGNPLYFILSTILAIIALGVLSLVCKDSKFGTFHVKHALRVAVWNLPVAFISVIPFIGWPAATLLTLFSTILSIIQFFSACAGKAKDVPCLGCAKFLN